MPSTTPSARGKVKKNKSKTKKRSKTQDQGSSQNEGVVRRPSRADEDVKLTSSSASAATSPVSKKRKRPHPPNDVTRPPENDGLNSQTPDEASDGTHSAGSASTAAPPPAYSFRSLTPPLSPGILSYLTSQSFHSMTPVQAATIPLFLRHKDPCVQAVTGSGKTLAFLIPLVEMILRRTVLLTRRQIGGLIISPTRELARQTYVVATDLCSRCSLSEPLLLVGGTSVSDDLKSFSLLGSDIVIGTPGRIEDILTRYDAVDVAELECLVLDEADVLLDLGFEVCLTGILSRLPKMRRTGLFSATRTGGKSAGGWRGFVQKAGLRNPVLVNVALSRGGAAAAGLPPPTKEKDDEKGKVEMENRDQDTLVEGNNSGPRPPEKRQQEQATPSSLSNYFLITSLDTKLSRLVSFLKSHPEEKCIVFFLTCACVEYYALVLRHLLPKDYYLESLHGKMVQKRREKSMERFRLHGNGPDDAADADAEGKGGGGGALLCTDVASRGLDVTDINWVVQFDPPSDPSAFVHRVGRSARAGRVGSSLIFLTEKEESYVDFLRLRKVPIEPMSNNELCAPPPQGTEEEGTKKETDRRRKSIRNEDSDGVEKQKEEDDEQEQRPMVQRVIRSASNPNVTIPDMLPRIRKLVLKDRDMLEKGTKAFTSYIRAYKEHHCAFIFRFASLDLGVLATSFSLLRLPKMPELKDKHDQLNFTPAGPEIDIHAIPFLDKVREKARQKRLASELAAGGKNAKQIKAERRLAEKLQRQKERRRAELDKGRNPNKKRGKQAQLFDEWDELAKEERLYKKLKRGKITKEKYKELMYGDKSKGEGAPSKAKGKGGEEDVEDDSDLEV